MGRRKTFDYCIGFVFVFFFAIAIFFDRRIWTPLIWIDAKEFDSQMNTVLQVQATVTTLGIALLSLLSGVTKEMYYGISVSQYIMQKKPLIFKHRTNVILELILIIGGFAALVFGFYNTLVVCLVVSLGIIGLMVWDIFVVFSGAKDVKEEIGAYCLHFFKKNSAHTPGECIYSAISDDISYAIETNNNVRIKDNLNMYNDILQTIVSNGRLVSSEACIARWEEAYVNTCIMLFKQGNGDVSLLTIESASQILSTCGQPESGVLLNIWDKIGPHFFDEIGQINQIALQRNGTLYHLHRSLYMSLRFKDNKQQNNLSIGQYSSNVYYFLKSAVKTESTEFSLIKRVLMEQLEMFVKWTFEGDVNKKIVAYQELNLYTKVMIDNLERTILNNTLEEWFAHNNWSIDETKHNCFILIYLYYLNLKEKLAIGKLKEFANEIAKENRNRFQFYFLWTYDRPNFITKEYVNEISKAITSWEIFRSGKGKILTMEYVVQEFFLFNFLAGEYGIDELIEKLDEHVKGKEFEYFSRFVGPNKARSQKMYEEFLEMFDLRSAMREKSTETIEKLESALTSIYKASESNKVNKLTRDNNEIERAIEPIKTELLHSLTGIIEPFMNNKVDSDNVSIVEQEILSFNTYAEHGLDEHSIAFIKKSITSNFIYLLARMIYQRATVEKVKSDDKNMLKTFFELVDSANIKPNTLVGYRNWFYGFAQQEEFALFERKMRQIRDDGVNNIVFAIDDRLLYVGNLNVEITVDHLTTEEILNSAEKQGEKYLYVITNDIKLPFEKEELIDYVSKLRRIIRAGIKAEYGYRSNIEKIGIGIEIEY